MHSRSYLVLTDIPESTPDIYFEDLNTIVYEALSARVNDATEKKRKKKSWSTSKENSEGL